jgi:hypothetical protein
VIDDHLISPWPHEVVDALDGFRQGDLVKDPPMFYWGDARFPLWQPTAEETEAGVADVVLLEEGSLDYAIITTQTCDLREQRTQKKPWFSVAPVYEFAEDSHGLWPLIEAGRVTYLTRVSGLEGSWVADTRIEMPVEKSWLVGKTSIAGFAGQDEYLTFAERLADARRRPAIADAIYQKVLRPLRDALKKLPTADAAALLGPVWEFRLAVSGDRTSPDAVQLVVLTLGPCPSPILEWFESWWDEARLSADSALVLLRPRFEDADSAGLSVSEYQTLIPLPFADISPE